MKRRVVEKLDLAGGKNWYTIMITCFVVRAQHMAFDVERKRESARKMKTSGKTLKTQMARVIDQAVINYLLLRHLRIFESVVLHLSLIHI